MNASSLLSAARLINRLAKNASPNDKLMAKAAAQTEKELTKLVASAKGWNPKDRAALEDPSRLEVMRATIFQRCVGALRRSDVRARTEEREQAVIKRREAILAAVEARRAMKAPPAASATTKSGKRK